MSSDVQNTEHLGAEQYNATLLTVREVHEALRVIRVRPDFPIRRFEPGQFTVLGLGEWEARIDGVTSSDRGQPRRLVRRAYSVSCPIIDEQGRLATCADCDFLEFYLSLVTRPSDVPPALTPRLFGAAVGDRLFVGRKFSGNYTLATVGRTDNLLFIATGTGEAPHNAMIAHLLSHGHCGKIVAVTSVRRRRDLAYLNEHRALERRYPLYRYVALITRERAASSPVPREFHEMRLQGFFTTGLLDGIAGQYLEPNQWQVFLCGSATMIGLPARDGITNSQRFPENTGMAELLTKRGFTLCDRDGGNIHFERYW